MVQQKKGRAFFKVEKKTDYQDVPSLRAATHETVHEKGHETGHETVFHCRLSKERDPKQAHLVTMAGVRACVYSCWMVVTQVRKPKLQYIARRGRFHHLGAPMCGGTHTVLTH